MCCKYCGHAIPPNNKLTSDLIDNLLSQSFEGWSEDAIRGYITACETIRHTPLIHKDPVTYNNFYISTIGIYELCDTPEIKPDYISTPTQIGNTPSKYWYGTDEGGDYVIRRANHWCNYYVDKDIVQVQNKKILKCKWDLRIKEHNELVSEEIKAQAHFTGKIYLRNYCQRGHNG